jgi:hypothetical protein
MPIALPQIYTFLQPGLFEITGKYPQLPKKRDLIYKSRNSNLALERSTATRYLSTARLKTEGGTTSFDNTPGQLYVYNQQHLEWGVGFAITRPAIDDNLYKSDFGPSVMGLMEAFNRTSEINAAAVLNNGTTIDPTVGGDGVSLFGVHPVTGSTFANRPSPDVDLNEASLLNGQVAINANFVDNANQKMDLHAQRLVVPSQLEPIAVRLLKTELRPGTAMNDVNAILSVQGGIPDGYTVWNYLTSQFAWFLKTDLSKGGLNHMTRVPYESDMSVEFSTDNLLVKGYMRESFNYDDPRAMYASFPTS